MERYILIGLVLALLIWRGMEAKQRQNRQEMLDRGDRGSFWLIYVSFYLIVAWSMADFYMFNLTQIRPLYPFLNFFGFVMFFAGFLLRYLSLKQLREFYSEEVVLIKNQRLIKDGIYAHLRHPAYSGLLLLGLAVPLICSDYGGILGFIVFLVSTVFYRIRIEEKFLIEKFGDEYEQYAINVKKLIPGIF